MPKSFSTLSMKGIGLPIVIIADHGRRDRGDENSEQRTSVAVASERSHARKDTTARMGSENRSGIGKKDERVAAEL